MTHFGTATGAGIPEEPIDFDGAGRPIFCRLVGSGFNLIVEGRPGTSGRQVGDSVFESNPENPAVRPDLLIQSNRPLGSNPSTAICDRGPAPDPIGGVPAINPPSLDATQFISDALNDFGCRFVAHKTTDDACTLNALGNNRYVNSVSAIQFCTAPAVGVELAFPAGDTILTAYLKDTSGNVGDERQIVVRAPCSP